ncbi:MAG: alpha-glucuronidase family glycosyl hydrolase, partial [Candidatus Sulfotelmatobacter sp.]
MKLFWSLRFLRRWKAAGFIQAIRLPTFAALIAIVCFAVLPQAVMAETEADAWLRYAPLDPTTAKQYQHLPERIVVLGNSIVIKTAGQELTLGIAKMTGRTLTSAGEVSGSAVILATFDQAKASIPKLNQRRALTGDAYWITRVRLHGPPCLLITSSSERGVLYGVFGLLSKIALGESIAHTDE